MDLAQFFYVSFQFLSGEIGKIATQSKPPDHKKAQSSKTDLIYPT